MEFVAGGLVRHAGGFSHPLMNPDKLRRASPHLLLLLRQLERRSPLVCIKLITSSFRLSVSKRIAIEQNLRAVLAHGPWTEP